MAPLTLDELVNHPEFPKTTWDLKPTQKGKVSVAKGRGGPFNVSYEVHGTGPVHIIFIMGLGSFKTAWQRQTYDFGHLEADKYSCLISDVRGMGESDAPLLRYTTSDMALDQFEIAAQVGWTAPRSLHLVGISMGGMIAQEMAHAQPARIASLSLVSTAARIVSTVGVVQNARDRINLLVPRSLPRQVELAAARLFPAAWLAAPDEIGGFPTNQDRFAAGEIAKRLDAAAYTRRGFLCQLIAAGWHHKSDEQLRALADAVGRRRIQVFHGTHDQMIPVPHADVLVQGLGGDGWEAGGVRNLRFEDRGHVIPIQDRSEFKSRVVELVEKAEAMREGEE